MMQCKAIVTAVDMRGILWVDFQGGSGWRDWRGEKMLSLCPSGPFAHSLNPLHFRCVSSQLRSPHASRARIVDKCRSLRAEPSERRLAFVQLRCLAPTDALPSIWAMSPILSFQMGHMHAKCLRDIDHLTHKLCQAGRRRLGCPAWAFR
jgi:hypothetical protein